MVTTEHEVLIDLARQAKPLVPELIHQIGGLDLPSYVEVRDESEDCGESIPIERRADAVQTLRDRRGRPVLSIVFEVQRSYKDEKWASWLSYTVTAINQYDCPTVLVVLCPKETEARGCRRTHDFGFGTIQLCPIVISYADIPVIDDAAEAARHLGLAMLSALAHGDRAGGMVLGALSVAFNTLAVDTATTYSDLMFTALKECLVDSRHSFSTWSRCTLVLDAGRRGGCMARRRRGQYGLCTGADDNAARRRIRRPGRNSPRPEARPSLVARLGGIGGTS
ncbi:hypothetical protein FB566_1626 [Stackebrandtia endophytica]|uniref:Uncharacterized protein n=1 Tax=Stackebrandtia endophytica TaxID=1496996 RepID=A0A543AU79_9ACTN|nr:hypothetical protein [Stackebrandtia endophytica]TQL76106.1 hypothetical protein FB566_1626 [Stackebrandtia endophytica]